MRCFLPVGGQFVVGGAIVGHVVLDWVRKQAEVLLQGSRLM